MLSAAKPYDNAIVLKLGVADDGTDCSALLPGAEVLAVVEKEHRLGCSIHHTATHLLHAALRERLGTQLAQSGSNVQAERLTFDLVRWRFRAALGH